MIDLEDPHLLSIKEEIEKHEQKISRINSKINNLLQEQFPEVASEFENLRHSTAHKKIGPPILLAIGGLLVLILPIILAIVLHITPP